MEATIMGLYFELMRVSCQFFVFGRSTPWICFWSVQVLLEGWEKVASQRSRDFSDEG